MAKVAAGREAMGGFAPKLAELNDDVSFGQVQSRTVWPFFQPETGL
jgi:hypothetical protein